MAAAQQQENKFAEFMVELFVYGALLIPLIVASSSSIFPFVFPKVIYFETVVGLATAAFVGLAYRKSGYLKFNSAYIKLCGLYGLVLALTGFTAVDPNRAFWSNHERMTGIVFVWHCLLFSVMIAVFYAHNRDRIERFLVYACGVASVVSLTGIYQKIDHSFLMGTGDRVAGTLGNPIYLGGYAAEFFLLSAYLAYRFRGNWMKWLMLSFALINFVGMYLSGTRSAVIGLVGALGVLVIVGLVNLWKNGRKKFVGVIISGIIACAVVIVLLSSVLRSWVPEGSLLERYTNISITNTTASTRFIAWNIAIKGFEERPLLGWGPENFYYAFNKYFNPKSLLFGTSETWFDHAHNAVFDTLVTEGVIGFIVYLAQFILIWWMCAKTFVKEGDSNERWLSATLAAIFVLHFIHNIFVFDHPGSYVVFYMFAGIVAARYATSRLPAPPTKMHSPIREPSYGIIAVQVAIIGIAGFVIIPSVRQNNLDLKAQIASYSDMGLAQQLFEQSIAINGPHTPDVLLDVGRVAQHGRITKDYFNFAVNSLDLLLTKYEPDNVLAAIMEGQILMSAVDAGNTELVAKADSVFAHAAELSPKRQQVYYAWARLKLITNRIDEGQKLLQKAVDDEPNVGISHWYLSVLVADTDPKRGARELDLALAHGFIIPDTSIRIAAALVYEKNNEYEKSADLITPLVEDPNSTGWDEILIKETDVILAKAHRLVTQQHLRERFPAVFQKKV